MFVVLGSFDSENGSQCGECEMLGDHAFDCNKHAVHIKLLASGRSTSKLLSLLRNDILRQRLADMSVGTLGEAMQKYEVRLQRANCRLTLEGKPYGFTPVFVRLDRSWIRPFHANRDCMDLVLDFLLPEKRDAGLSTPGSDTDDEGRVVGRAKEKVFEGPGQHYGCLADWARIQWQTRVTTIGTPTMAD